MTIEKKVEEKHMTYYGISWNPQEIQALTIPHSFRSWLVGEFLA